jgi:adenylate cyclase
MLGKLAPCAGGPPIPLLKPKLLVGRHPNCDVHLAFSSVSARHCELELVDGYWLVRDLGSTNGTRVNGTACTTTAWLLPNAVLGVAKYRYSVAYRPPPGRPPPQATAPAPAATAPQRPPPPPPPVPDTEVEPPAPSSAAAAGPPLGKLVPCGGGAPILLTRPRLVVGRHETCDVVLRSPAVSGRHCQLDWADGVWSVRDLGSKNGLRVDGVRCEEHRLPPGSVLWVGGLRFELVYNAPGSAARPQPKPSLFGQSLLEKAGLTRWRPPEPPARGRGAADGEEPARERYNLDDPV